MTKQAEEFVLQHIGVYDAAKRREYYLRTRQLKGRQKGSSDEPQYGSSRQAVVKPKPKTVSNPAAEVEAIKARLETLRTLLRKLVAEAKGRSGVESKTKTKSKEDGSSTGSGSNKPLTQKQKRARAESLEKARKERKDDLKDKPKPEGEALEDRIAEVRMQIFDIRRKLQAAVQRAQNQKTATGR